MKTIDLNKINNDILYPKWREYFEKHVMNLYNRLISELDRNQILYGEYDYELFCRFLYNNSSKRIPKY